jgi:hypothetical protein
MVEDALSDKAKDGILASTREGNGSDGSSAALAGSEG